MSKSTEPYWLKNALKSVEAQGRYVEQLTRRIIISLSLYKEIEPLIEGFMPVPGYDTLPLDDAGDVDWRHTSDPHWAFKDADSWSPGIEVYLSKTVSFKAMEPVFSIMMDHGWESHGSPSVDELVRSYTFKRGDAGFVFTVRAPSDSEVCKHVEIGEEEVPARMVKKYRVDCLDNPPPVPELEDEIKY